MTPPRLLLVHGAFHGAWCWNRLRPELEGLGISHETVDLPFTSTEDDVAAVRSVIDSSDESVTVLGHSFGGAVIAAAAAEGGRPYGTTTSLIFLTAFMTAPEQRVDFSGAPGMADIQLGEVTASIDPNAARSVFYHRCSTEDADWATAHLRTMPTSVLIAPPPPSPAWQVLPSTYIVCTDDRILSLSAQEQMAENADSTIRIDSDHSPFLSCPSILSEVLSEIISDVGPNRITPTPRTTS
jgi:pimeloyl-ACP methyl ester carboxylesterase